MLRRIFGDNTRGGYLGGRQSIRLLIRHATTKNLRMHHTLGVRAMHITCHGHEGCLTFEDGFGGLHPVEAERGATTSVVPMKTALCV